MNEEILDRIAVALEAIASAMQAQETRTYAWTPEGLPICPRHGAVMKRREKQGDTWYSHRVGEFFCRGYAGKNSPGWDIDTTPTQNDDDEPEPPRDSNPPSTPKPTPRPAPPSPDTVSALDALFPRPAPATPAPGDPRAVMRDFNQLAASLISGGRIPAGDVSVCARLANTEATGWTAALDALRTLGGAE